MAGGFISNVLALREFPRAPGFAKVAEDMIKESVEKMSQVDSIEVNSEYFVERPLFGALV